jgi:hypothetical protein
MIGKEATRFVKLRLDILARPDLTPAAKLIWAAIADHARGNGSAWPGIRRLARNCGVNVKTVNKAVGKLKERELLIVEHRGNGRSNLYRLPDQTVPESTAPPKLERSQNVPTGAPKRGALAHHLVVHKQREPLKQRRESARRKAAAPDPRIKQFIDWFAGEYKTSQDRTYIVLGGKDGATIKRLLQSLSLSELQEAAKNMLADTWGKDRASIGVLASQINTWRGKKPRSKERTDHDYSKGF